MARLRFRVTTIHLDDEEDVEAITAIVRDDCHRGITDLLGEDFDLISTARGGTEMTVRLPAPQMLELFRAVGKLAPVDPRYEACGAGDVYYSLSCVVDGLMEND